MRGVQLGWRNWLVYLAVILLMVGFYFALSTGAWMKRPLGADEDVEGYLDDLHRAVKSEDWRSADNLVPELEEAWDRVISRLQLVLELDEGNRFARGLVRLKVAVMREDTTRALTEIAEMRHIWQDMGR